MKRADITLILSIISILSLFFLNSPSFAQDCEKINIPTPSGEREFPEGWEPGCECDEGKPTIYLSNDTVKRNEYIEIWVDSGGDACPTYTWVISGTGFHLNSISGPATDTTEADSEKLELWADDTACGSVIITVTDSCGENYTSSAREPDNGQWVLIEEITCGTVDPQPGAGNCHSDYYCTEGGYRYLDSWVAGTNMGSRWHPIGNCTKYPCTPYTSNYCYDPGYYPKFYHVGIQYKKKWRWDCQ